MSLINQVLKDLDRRGQGAHMVESNIRVVHRPARRSPKFIVPVLWGGVILLAFASVFLVWQKKTPVPLPAVLSGPAQTAAALAVLHTAVAAVAPRIDRLLPETVVASGRMQTLTVAGGNFAPGARVMLGESEGRVYPNRPYLLLEPDRIVLKLNFGSKAGKWWIEVVNADGNSTGGYAFAVSAGPAAVLPALTAEMPVPLPVVRGSVPIPGISKLPTQMTVQQQAENEFRKAYGLLQRGQLGAAMHGYETALQLDAGHLGARQALAHMLADAGRNADAERLLREGLRQDPAQSSLALLLARMQFARNEVAMALETMQQALPYALKQAEYQAYMAALLQRMGRHNDAIEHFQSALQYNPQSGVWQMGLGISLRAAQRNAEARDAFGRARDTRSLNAELQAFVLQQLQELSVASERF